MKKNLVGIIFAFVYLMMCTSGLYARSSKESLQCIDGVRCELYVQTDGMNTAKQQ